MICLLSSRIVWATSVRNFRTSTIITRILQVTLIKKNGRSAVYKNIHYHVKG